jgi:peptidoglycan/LPS O-acetylase OafA/YrhL
MLTIWTLQSQELLVKSQDRWFGIPFWYGHGAVAAFITISGFCLALPMATKGRDGWRGSWNFYKRRMRRILPPLYGAIALSVFLIWAYIGDKTGTHWDMSIPISWKSILAILLNVQNVWEQAKVNHAFWSLGVEMQIYLCFPIFAWLFMIRPWLPALVFVPLGYFAQLKIEPTPWAAMTFLFYGVFALGMLAAHFWSRGLKDWERVIAMVLVVGGAAAVFATTFLKANPWQSNRLILDLIVAVAIAAIMSLGINSWTGRILSAPFLQYLGLFSYSIYLVHAPLLQVWWQLFTGMFHLEGRDAFLMMAFVATPLSIAVARGFFEIFEKPLVPEAAKHPESVFVKRASNSDS